MFYGIFKRNYTLWYTELVSYLISLEHFSFNNFQIISLSYSFFFNMIIELCKALGGKLAESYPAPLFKYKTWICWCWSEWLTHSGLDSVFSPLHPLALIVVNACPSPLHLAELLFDLPIDVPILSCRSFRCLLSIMDCGFRSRYFLNVFFYINLFSMYDYLPFLLDIYS